MNSPAAPTAIAYFGKVPTRTDFVRSSPATELLDTVEYWVRRSMELFIGEPRWKLTYDGVTPTHFVFLDSERREAIAGYLVAGSDATQRRFPFIAATSFEVVSAANFAGRSPLALVRPWHRLELAIQNLLTAADASGPLALLQSLQLPVDTSIGAYDASFLNFVETQSIGTVQSLLRRSGLEISVRRMLLALGLLLKTRTVDGTPRPDRGLVMPLPPDPVYRALVATLWLDIISRFLGPARFELLVFVTARANRHRLTVVFDGAPASALRAVLDPRVGDQQNLSLENAEWVENPAQADARLKKLSGLLDQPRLPWRAARESFLETFIPA